MKRNRLTLKVLMFLMLYDLMETGAHFCFKKTALLQNGFKVTQAHDVLIFAQHALATWYLWVGLATVVLIFTTWTFILSKLDLSVAIPVASLTYVLIAIASMVFFHEHISPLRWAGIGTILTGVILVTLSEPVDEQVL